MSTSFGDSHDLESPGKLMHVERDFEQVKIPGSFYNNSTPLLSDVIGKTLKREYEREICNQINVTTNVIHTQVSCPSFTHVC